MKRRPTEAADVALIGGYPPPWGGITVHLKRLGPLLDSAGISWRLYNVSSESRGAGDRVVPVFRRRQAWLMKYAFTANERIIHIHGMEAVAARLVALPLSWLRRRHVILSYHNSRIIHEFAGLSAAVRGALLAQWKASSRIHVVNHDLAVFLQDQGVEERRIIEYPAFLPPVPDATAVLAPPLCDFMARSPGALLAIGSGARDNGRSTYGLDLLLPMLRQVRERQPGVRLVIVAHSGATGEEPLFSEVLEAARACALEDEVRIVQSEGDLTPLMQAALAYVRPSRTDGDAVAVREALFLGVPVIASNAAARPAGVDVFVAEDVGDFAQQVVTALERPRREARRQILSSSDDYGGMAIAMYRELLQ